MVSRDRIPGMLLAVANLARDAAARQATGIPKLLAGASSSPNLLLQHRPLSSLSSGAQSSPPCIPHLGSPTGQALPPALHGLHGMCALPPLALHGLRLLAADAKVLSADAAKPGQVRASPHPHTCSLGQVRASPGDDPHVVLLEHMHCPMPLCMRNMSSSRCPPYALSPAYALSPC